MGCLSAILIFFRTRAAKAISDFDQAQLLPRRAFAKKIPYQALKVGGYLYGCMAVLPGRKGGRGHEEHYRPTLDLTRIFMLRKFSWLAHRVRADEFLQGSEVARRACTTCSRDAVSSSFPASIPSRFRTAGDSGLSPATGDCGPFRRIGLKF